MFLYCTSLLLCFMIIPFIYFLALIKNMLTINNITIPVVDGFTGGGINLPPN